ncbi:MAG: NTP transferase domain-containing protein [Candidatus Lokiarchaeota archaeon]|nr:NTP transferase domain-containing protein [Candidatus Lokiarchaeota archaeon]
MTQVVIVAGGLGTRIAPVAKDRPKCMVEVDGRPFCQYQLEIFKKQGFTEIIFCLGHLADIVMDFFKDGSKFGLHIDYSIEKEPLGTAGAVKLAEGKISGDFMVYYGDNFTTMNFKDFLAFHEKTNGIASISLRKKPDGAKGSSIITMDAGRINEFIEKPTSDICSRYQGMKTYVNNGIYACKRRLLDHVPMNKACDFGLDLFPTLIERGEEIYGHVTDSYFREIGTPRKFDAFVKEFTLKKNDLIQA